MPTLLRVLRQAPPELAFPAGVKKPEGASGFGKGSLKQIRQGIDFGAVVGLGFSIYPQIYP
jgi:hypothetical protein